MIGKKFIVYMNGQVTKVKGSGKKQIEPGCEIIVPSKAKKKTNIGNILSYATTFSTLFAYFLRTDENRCFLV